MICVALAADSAAERTGGNALVSPTTMIVKNIPMERTKTEFINVDIMPEVTPRLSAGTEFMIAAAFGEANIPFPRLIIRRASAKGR